MAWKDLFEVTSYYSKQVTGYPGFAVFYDIGGNKLQSHQSQPLRPQLNM